MKRKLASGEGHRCIGTRVQAAVVRRHAKRRDRAEGVAGKGGMVRVDGVLEPVSVGHPAKAGQHEAHVAGLAFVVAESQPARAAGDREREGRRGNHITAADELSEERRVARGVPSNPCPNTTTGKPWCRGRRSGGASSTDATVGSPLAGYIKSVGRVRLGAPG